MVPSAKLAGKHRWYEGTAKETVTALVSLSWGRTGSRLPK